MADQDQIQDCDQTPTTDTTSKSCVEEEQETYTDSDSDCGSDSSVVTVVHSPLEDSALSNLQLLRTATSEKASKAPLSSSSFSSSLEAQLSPRSIRLPPAAPSRGGQRSSTLSSAFKSLFTGRELELNQAQKPIRFATATPAQALGLESEPPATTEQFPVLEPRPIRPRPNTFQLPELPPRRHRVGSLVGPNSGIGSPPRFPAPPIPHRSSHHRSASASATYISSSSRNRSALTEQPPNFSLPLRGFQLAESTESFPKLLPVTSRPPSAPLPPADPPLERRRTRARSNAVRGENPLEVPITTQEYQLANLVRTINQNNEREADQKARLITREVAGRGADLRRTDGHQDSRFVGNRSFAPSESTASPSQGHRAATFSSRQPLPTPLEDPIDRSATPTPRSYSASGSRIQSTQFPSIDPAVPNTRQSNIQDTARTRSFLPPTSAIEPPTNPVELYIRGQANHEHSRSSTQPTLGIKPSNSGDNSGDLQIWRLQLPPIPSSVLESIFAYQHQALKCANTAKNMNFQSYGESPQGGPSNPRQAPPSPSQGMNHQNGVNGGMAPGAGLIGYPTPAGHQSDLNYVMSMVDELANVLRMNQQLTANVVDKMGKVREKAKHLNLNNDELMAAAAGEMSEESHNMDKEISELRKSLEDSEYHKRENFKLAVHGAEILSDIAEKVHKFKASHEADTLAWHKNYRKQLADEREENLRLRNEMNDLKAGACRANEHMRDMRRYLSDNDERHELRVENHRLRTEKRFWKRLALPLIPDDDSEWSDDDDLIDPEEKTRLEAALKEKERIAKDEAEGEGSGGPA